MRLLWFNLRTDAADPVLAFGVDWLNAVAGRVEAVDVLTMHAGRAETAPNVAVYSVGKERGYGEPRRVLEFYRILRGLLRAHRYDACFAHMMPLFSVLGAPLLYLYRVPITLWYAHGHVPLRLRIAERFVRKIVTSSPHGCRLKSRKVVAIGQGINLENYAFKPALEEARDALRILFVGRISSSKGVHTLIEAVARLGGRSTVDPTLRIIGAPRDEQDSRYARSLERQVAASGLGHRVEFLGWNPPSEVWKYYISSDVFVNPSHTGSMDKTVLEAMASGCLVITGNPAYDTPEFRAAGGIFAGNDPEHICNALTRVVEMSKDEKVRRLESGRRWVETRHSLDALAGRLIREMTFP